ncbi:DoxX family protein [Pedobacter rhodius]|uniref:DoxX family protein n=1 Tax=Pedobacter rhodius TaxID=3004098 RepID=A0ABT4L170_9SPHI|nr:DoxX family protein [Pedobacter sp. SJ11]MCZ4224930.1 DoxX family protein [Pedobacter sp. SJ11]
MSNNITSNESKWTNAEMGLFRFFFIYFILQTLPLSVDFFHTIFGFNWFHIRYGDIFNVSRLSAKFIPGADTFLNWLILAVLSAGGAFLWSRQKPGKYNYDELYYWLRAIVRYRLAIGIIGYGFLKFFPMQAPFPSISNLNTAYGDFSEWKIFSMTLGIVPGYESFLGGVELVAGLLLLFRKTASIGAIIVLIFTGNVFISNLGYGGGEYVYASYLISFAVFVLWFDAQRIYRLISLELPTQPNRYKPAFKPALNSLRLLAKAFILIFFVFFYGLKTYFGWRRDPYQFPQKSGLAKTAGIYNVSEFKLNGKIVPYDPANAARWQDVVFEKWATISIRSPRPVITDSANYEQIFAQDKDRNYELAGSGGRHYYSYEVDTAKQQLLLQNKNSHYLHEKLRFNFSRPDTATIILAGKNEVGDSIAVTLVRINKKYPLKLGRRKTLKL